MTGHCPLCGAKTPALEGFSVVLDENVIVVNGGEPVRVTPAVAELLATLANHAPRVATYDAIRCGMVGSTPDRDLSDDLIHVYVHHARKALSRAGGGVEIQTVRAKGYILCGSAPNGPHVRHADVRVAMP